MIKHLLTVIFLVALMTEQAMAGQRLACFYYDENNPHGGNIIYKMLGPALPFEWAKNPANEALLFEGREYNGFFEIDGVSQEQARDLCTKTLKAVLPGKQTKLLSMAVRPSTWSNIYIPAAFSQKKALEFNKLIICGDSLSDQGTIRDMLKIIPSPPYFAGRFTNGRNWVDYLQDAAGFSVLNLATAGSLSGQFLEVNFHSKKYLPKRWWEDVSSYLSGTLKDQLASYQKKLKGERIESSSTLISIWSGSNDYLAFIEDNEIADRFLDYPNHDLGYNNIIKRSTDNIIEMINSLYAMGARNFLIPSIPDLGKLPRILENTSYHFSEQSDAKRFILLSNKMSYVSEQHNLMLIAKLDELRRNLDINIIYVDIRGELKKMPPIILAEIVLSHEGSSAIIGRACYDNYYYVFLSSTAICEQPDKSFFLDGVHPTTFGHSLFAAFIHEALAQKDILPRVSLKEYMSKYAPSWLDYEAQVKTKKQVRSCKL